MKLLDDDFKARLRQAEILYGVDVDSAGVQITGFGDERLIKSFGLILISLFSVKQLFRRVKATCCTGYCRLSDTIDMYFSFDPAVLHVLGVSGADQAQMTIRRKAGLAIKYAERALCAYQRTEYRIVKIGVWLIATARA